MHAMGYSLAYDGTAKAYALYNHSGNHKYVGGPNDPVFLEIAETGQAPIRFVAANRVCPAESYFPEGGQGSVALSPSAKAERATGEGAYPATRKRNLGVITRATASATSAHSAADKIMAEHTWRRYEDCPVSNRYICMHGRFCPRVVFLEIHAKYLNHSI